MAITYTRTKYDLVGSMRRWVGKVVFTGTDQSDTLLPGTFSLTKIQNVLIGGSGGYTADWASGTNVIKVYESSTGNPGTETADDLTAESFPLVVEGY